jgi:protein gp37
MEPSFNPYDYLFNSWTLRNGEPHRRSSTYWRQPLTWNKEAARNLRSWEDFPVAYRSQNGGDYRRPRVFCLSLGDWLDDRVPIEWLADLLKLIHDTPNLDWLLLTKRPENWERRLLLAENQAVTSHKTDLSSFISDWIGSLPPANVWIGTTVENQARAERIPLLLSIPAKVRFLSCEPLLQSVDLKLRDHLTLHSPEWTPQRHVESQRRMQNLSWVICGGESGPHARPMHPDWARSLRDQCQAAGVPFFFKQWGEWAPSYPPDSADYIDINGDRYGMPGTDAQKTVAMKKVGKRNAGRLLDGREWNEFPALEVGLKA